MSRGDGTGARDAPGFDSLPCRSIRARESWTVESASARRTGTEEAMSWTHGSYRLEEGAAAVDPAAVHRLLSTSYWASGRTPAQIERTLANSTCFSLLHADGQVGFFRALSDVGAYTYLMDFIIEDAHRGQGLGSWCLDVILAFPAFAGTRFILVTKDAQAFYSRAGFVRHPFECMMRV